METLLLKADQNGIEKAGEILARGGLVGIPTETVYGLAANALDGEAVARIFRAKGRPMDNPLIVHIADVDDINRFSLISEVPAGAVELASAFWPGPLTIIMPKGKAIPDEVSAGLDTVAIRLPEHMAARAVIRAADRPLAAPSANLSGSPSPTTAQHVLNDMDGKIEAVLDGGVCRVGVESTVVTLAGDKPRLLRPGGITLDRLESVLGEVEVDDAVLNKLRDGETAASPGMKYKHYAPKAHVVLIKADDDAYIDYVNSHADDGVAALCYENDVRRVNVKAYSMGRKDDYSSQAHALFDALRAIDDDATADIVYARCPKPDGIGLAVYNRLIRAAGFEVIDLEEV